MLFPQFLLVDLAYRLARQGGDKCDLAQRLIIRQRLTTVRFKNLCINLRAGDDEGFDFFAQALGRNTDHRRFDN